MDPHEYCIMRILIHALSVKQRGGSDRHLGNFLPALEMIENINEYFLYVDEDYPIGQRARNIHVTQLSVNSPARRLWWDQVTLPRIAREQHIDLIVALLSFGSARPPCPQIAYLRNPLHCPYYLRGLSRVEKMNVQLRRYFLYLTLKASRLIVTPSAAAREMVRAVHPDLSFERFRILPHGFDKQTLTPPADLPAHIAAQWPVADDNCLKILYVGHILPYKGFDAVLDAAISLKRQAVQFKMFLTIGPEDGRDGFERWQTQVRRHNLSDQLIALGKVPKSAVGSLYDRSDLLIFPSLCETFGWPIIEAMSFGLPIVAADTLLTREMAGDAALYYPPFDGVSAAAAIQRIQSDSKLYAAMRQAGLTRGARHIGWKEYAERSVAYFAEAVAKAAARG